MSDRPAALDGAAPGPVPPSVGMAAPPAARAPMPMARALLYFAASLVFGITQGLGSNLVTANLQTVQGFFGATAAEASWLSAAYLATSTTASVVLFKIRFQFGLRIFAELGLLLFIAVTLAHLLVNDLRTAILARAVLGLAAAPLSSIALLYAFEPLSPEKKFTVGLCVGVVGPQLAAPLARVISPDLLQTANWQGLYLLEVGLAFVCLPLLYVLPLTPIERMTMFDRTDAVSLPLLGGGFGLLVVSMTFGPLYWWTAAPWIGLCLASSLALLTAFLVLELHRSRPSLNLRWVSTADVLALAGALLVFRLLLSEQTVGVVGFLRLFNLVNDQEHQLFWIVLAATAAGYAFTACAVRPQREIAFHVAALALIASAAFLDSRATSLWGPEQFYGSQAMIAFAGGLFLPTAMMAGFRRALALGRQNLLSFVILFATTQSVGALVSSAFLQSVVTVRQRFHLGVLSDQLAGTDPLVGARIAQYGAGYAGVLADPGARSAQGLAALGGTATREAGVLAYADVFLLVSGVAAAALVLLLLHAGLRTLLSTPAAADRVNG